MYVISIYSQKLANVSDIEFKPIYLKYQIHMQQNFTQPGSLAKVKLLRLLLNIDSLGNIFLADNPRTAEENNNIVVILLVLFVSRDLL